MVTCGRSVPCGQCRGGFTPPLSARKTSRFLRQTAPLVYAFPCNSRTPRLSHPLGASHCYCASSAAPSSRALWLFPLLTSEQELDRELHHARIPRLQNFAKGRVRKVSVGILELCVVPRVIKFRAEFRVQLFCDRCRSSQSPGPCCSAPARSTAHAVYSRKFLVVVDRTSTPSASQKLAALNQ